MEHIFLNGKKDNPVLVMFHGTGGNERSLLDIAKEIDPESPILGIRGSVKESGMNRFFRRLSEGVFDEDDIKFRTNETYDFIKSASIKYNFDLENMVAIGYSNGANIIASMLYIKGGIFKGAILHHPMVPLKNFKTKDLSKVEIFIGAGRNDSITPMIEAKKLKNELEYSNANVTINWEDNGHQLTISEVLAAKEWYIKHLK